MARAMRFKQAMPSLQLSVERGTPDVPDDGRFHVVVAGQIRFSSPSERHALSFYREERDRLYVVHGRPEPEEMSPEDRQRWIQEQRVQFDLRAMNQDLVRTVVANARRKGGKGR